MAYFGGGGVAGGLHPSLQAYIDCFKSSPFPKMFPRGGGIWDQDPILIRDFRVIANFEREWKEAQDQLQNASGPGMAGGIEGGGAPGGLEAVLDEYIQSLEEDGTF